MKLTKAMRDALADLSVNRYVASTSVVFDRLVSAGLATDEGLRLSSRNTFKSSYSITDAGRAALDGVK